MRLSWLAALLLHLPAMGQEVPVPFTTVQDVFMVFANGRFTKLEARPPQQFFAQPGRLVYQDHEGRLKVYRSDGHALNLLDTGPIGKVAASSSRIAWTVNDSLRMLHGGRVITLATSVVRFTVSDSLVVYQEFAGRTIRVWRKGEQFLLAELDEEDPDPSWEHGGNMVLHHAAPAGALLLFRNGVVHTLIDSTERPPMTAAGTLAAYWDRGRREFILLEGDKELVLSGMEPQSAKAGHGLLAFVDGMGRLNCYSGGEQYLVSGLAPAAYWVQDSLLLFPQQGHFMQFIKGSTITVERYIPEQWRVVHSRLVYLNMDRQLHGMAGGAPLRYGQDNGIPHFELYGDAVVFPGKGGSTIVRRGRKSYSF